MQLTRILFEIDREIKRLLQARDLLADRGEANTKRRVIRGPSKKAKTTNKEAGKRKLSTEERRKISTALTARRAVRKKQTSNKSSR